MSDYDRIVGHWTDAASLEEFVANDCGWAEHRLTTWERWNEQLRQAGRRMRIPVLGWTLTLRRRDSFFGRHIALSAETKKVYQKAEELSPHRVQYLGREVRLVTTELVLLAFAKTGDVQFSRRLLESGLAIDRLEATATRAIAYPEKLIV